MMTLEPKTALSESHCEVRCQCLITDIVVRTAAVHPFNADRSVRPESSGSAEMLTPLLSNASVTLKSDGSKPCDRADDARARVGIEALILMLFGRLNTGSVQEQYEG